jgi:SpoVK/Ycf46/Vps4 family AAA+-type ATPase
MSERYEQKLTVEALHGLMLQARQIVGADGWLERYLHYDAKPIGIDLSGFAEGDDEPGLDRLTGRRRRRSYRTISTERWRQIREAIVTRARTLRAVPAGPLERTMRKVALMFRLEPGDAAILGLLVRLQLDHPLASFWRHTPFVNTRLAGDDSALVSAGLCGLSRDAFVDRLMPARPLLASGLLAIDHDGDITVLSRLLRVVRSGAREVAEVDRVLIGRPADAELGWEDFAHLGPDRDLLARVLEGAVRSEAPGVHVLLYGPPGTGKTEFAKTVARHIGVRLFGAGETDEEGGEPVRRERVHEYRMLQRLLAERRPALVLFDEADDMFEVLADSGGHPLVGAFRPDRGASRVYVHRQLEQAAIPTLWTTNHLGALGRAVLRRMTLAIEVRVPPPMVRRRLWRSLLDREAITAGDADVDALARDFDAPPGIAAGALRAASLTGGGVPEIRHAIRGIARAMNGGRPLPPRPSADVEWDPTLANADTDLERLAERLTRDGAPRAVSFCLSGPPGTGKSAWVRHLAGRMGCEVIHKRASDLLSMWVGQSEAQIAEAFEEARLAEAFLVIDEADGLLSDRRGAERSWEVTQVNEMLTWMESHPHPFACTTNLADRLDAASLRRFTFKIVLEPLTANQRGAAFRRFFALDPPAGLGQLDPLTPGDFAVVRKKAQVLGHDQDPGALLAMLAEEVRAKPGHGRPIGFERD